MDYAFEPKTLEWEQGGGDLFMPQQVVIPPRNVVDAVPFETYNAYRLGRDSACIDAIVTTHLHGRPVALLSKRSAHASFPNLWWMHGGAIPAYGSLLDFLVKRVARECGVDILGTMSAYVGLYRTCAPAQGPTASTLQPCFAFYVKPEAIEQATTDNDHSAVQAFTLEAYQSLPQQERHWYPDRVMERVLGSMLRA